MSRQDAAKMGKISDELLTTMQRREEQFQQQQAQLFSIVAAMIQRTQPQSRSRVSAMDAAQIPIQFPSAPSNGTARFSPADHVDAGRV